MVNTFAGFKSFVEEMDPSAEKDRETALGEPEGSEGKEDYFAALGDEQGIPWDDLTKVFTGEPWISAHFGLGSPDKEMLYKLSPWEIVRGTLTPAGADIRLKPTRGTRSYLKGNKLYKGDYQDNKRYHLSRPELIKFLTTGWTPAVQAAAGGMPA
jgi:hypothetical protein